MQFVYNVIRMVLTHDAAHITLQELQIPTFWLVSRFMSHELNELIDHQVT